MTKVEYKGSPKVSIENDRDGERLKVSVGGEDVNVNFNISYDTAKKLFDRFWRGARKYGDSRTVEEKLGSTPFELGSAVPMRESESGKSILFNVEGESIWVPKKVIHDDSEVWKMDQEEGTLTVKYWWAEKEGYA